MISAGDVLRGVGGSDPPPRGRQRSRVVLLGALCIVLFGTMLAGCGDPVLELFKNSGYHFSIYGYLDVSADTQWVRVMPPRTTPSTSSESSDATVTLEGLDTGEAVVLQDSIFQYASRSSPLYLHNFWTTMEIRPGRRYRLTAMRPDGRTSMVNVIIPEEFPVTVEYAPSGAVANVRVEGAEHVPFVKVRHHMPEDCEAWDGPPFYHSVAFEPEPVSPGIHEADVNLTPGSGPTVLPCPAEDYDVLVVASGEEWPSSADFSTEALGVEGQLSNVENGLGYLGGVLTKAVPWEP